MEDDPSSSNPNAAAELRQLISEAGLSQRAAARELGIDERTMRYWCAGNPPPPAMALRALNRRVAHRLTVLRTIEQNKQQIEMFESGRMTIGYGPELGTPSAAAAEAYRLRQQNEELESLLRSEDAFQRYQEAIFAVRHQFLPHGNGQPSEDSLAELEAAKAEHEAARREMDRIVAEIHAGKRR
jgi:transcriptional regulator with XRE-family HTH domain